MLDKQLKEYGKSDFYPFHMPGHKRRNLDAGNPYAIDITEIEGFDNLHEARGILKDAQQRAAKLYGAKESFYLVNGSTCGLLAAISATVKKRGKILVARNCHKAVYNGILLQELDAVYVYPRTTRLGIQGEILPQDIQKELEAQKDIQAVLITSPTYDGIVSDVQEIAKIVHSYGIPLIVDGAHGAHLGFVGTFPANPITEGADVVIESVHKTLPSLTQTALLHLCSSRVSAERLQKYLSIYQTSSPSYVLMASIDKCIHYIEENGKKDLENLRNNLNHFYEKAKALTHLYILNKADIVPTEAYDFDDTKILIFSKSEKVSGMDLYQILLQKYHLQMEMVSGQYVLALCSLMDTQEGLQRLLRALEEIDNSGLFMETTKEDKKIDLYSNIYRKQNQKLPIYKVEELKQQICSLEEAVGKIAGTYLYLYPPGIPIIVPGEEITKELCEDIKVCQKAGLTVEGLASEERISIVNFS